jgi:hypothetical protein
LMQAKFAWGFRITRGILRRPLGQEQEGWVGGKEE